MKFDNGKVILNKKEMAKLSRFGKMEFDHSICSGTNCTSMEKMHCDICPFKAVDAALIAMSTIARREFEK